VDVDRFHDRSVLAGLAGLLDGVVESEKKEKEKGNVEVGFHEFFELDRFLKQIG